MSEQERRLRAALAARNEDGSLRWRPVHAARPDNAVRFGRTRAYRQALRASVRATRATED